MWLQGVEKVGTELWKTVLYGEHGGDDIKAIDALIKWLGVTDELLNAVHAEVRPSGEKRDEFSTELMHCL